ncbi:MAG: methyltransferase domain-containing protein [Theionarchaea archaeon]|nr:methyltransferase domain-containing protein [Theionarchaea archaeon]
MIIQRREEIEKCFKKYYSRLAKLMVDLADIPDNAVVLEAGCGGGALTTPLLSMITPSLYVCYDLYSGVYEHLLDEIKTTNSHVVRGDIREISFSNDSVDAVFSNELLCELTRKDTQKAVNEIYRILRPDGVFVHGVLSPYPENKAQALVMLANEYSTEPLFPKEWFSPPADEMAGMLHLAGFSMIGVRYFEEVLRFEGDIAFEQVKTWVTKPEFFEKYSEDLEKHGLEYPMEQVVYCWK